MTPINELPIGIHELRNRAALGTTIRVLMSLGVLLAVRSAGAAPATMGAARDLFANAEFDRAREVLWRIVALETSDCASGEALGLVGLCYLQEGKPDAANEAFREAFVRCPTWRPGADFTQDEIRLLDEVRMRFLSSSQAGPADTQRPEPERSWSEPFHLPGRWSIGVGVGAEIPRGALGRPLHYAGVEVGAPTNAVPDAGILGGAVTSVGYAFHLQYRIGTRVAVLSDVRLVTWELDEGSWYRTAGTDLEYSMVRSALLTKISLAGPIYGKLGGGVAVESFRLFGSGWVLEDDDAHLGIEVSIEETRYYPMGVAGLGLDIGIGTHVGVYVDGSASWLASNRGDSPVAELDGNRHRYLGPAGMPSRSSSVLDLTAGLRFAL